MKLQASVKIPANIVGADGDKVIRASGTYTVRPDYGSLTPETSVGSPSTVFTRLWDSVGLTYLRVSVSNLVAIISSGLGLGSLAFQSAGAVAITGGRITGLALPLQGDEATNRDYVNSVALGLLPKPEVQFKTAGPLPNSPTYSNGTLGVGATLTATGNAALVVDSSVVPLGDDFMVADEAAPATNGIWHLTTAGNGVTPWQATRRTDFDTAAEMLRGSYFLVVSGATNKNSNWSLNATVATVGTDPVKFNKIQSSGQTLFVNVKDFGAVGDGVTDDAVPLYSALSFISVTGGVLFFPPGIYCTTQELSVCDGNATTISSVHKITLQGSGGGYNQTTPAAGGTTIKWTGTSNPAGTLLTVRGPAVGINIRDISFEGSAFIGVLCNLIHVHLSDYRNLSFVNFNTRGLILTSYPDTTAVAWGGNDNNFENIYVGSQSNTGAVGITVGPEAVTGVLDCYQNVFNQISVEFIGGTGNRCIQLQYCDGCKFIGVTTASGSLGGGAAGVFIQEPTGSSGWPSGISFDTTNIVGNVVASNSWTGGGIEFRGYSTGDGAAIPDRAGIFGTTNLGHPFSASILISNGSNAALPDGAGLVTVTDLDVFGASATYLLGGGGALVAQTNGGKWVAPTTTPAAGHASIEYDGTHYHIYNNLGANCRFSTVRDFTRLTN